MKQVRDFVAKFERHKDAYSKSGGVENVSYALKYLVVEDAILNLLCLRIVRGHEHTETGCANQDPTEEELRDALKWTGDGKTALSGSEFCRHVGKADNCWTVREEKSTASAI